MGIEGENDRSIKMGGFFCHAGHNGLGFLGTKTS